MRIQLLINDLTSKRYRNYLLRRYILSIFLKFFSRLIYCLRGIIPTDLYRLKEPIFIVGCSRSGTTFFTDTVSQHPDICNWSEAAQILELGFYDKKCDHVKTVSDVSPEDTFRIRLLFGIKTQVFRAKCFVNKHPENSLRMAWLKHIFPDAKFIHLYRNGRAVVASNYQKTIKDRFRRDWPFGQFPKPKDWKTYVCLSLEEQFAVQWVDVTSAITRFANENLVRSDYLELRYEDFCNKPEKLLKKLMNFVGWTLVNGNLTNYQPSLCRNTKLVTCVRSASENQN